MQVIYTYILLYYLFIARLYRFVSLDLLSIYLYLYSLLVDSIYYADLA